MKMLKERIGFLGCGNMGLAILEGMLKKRLIPAHQAYGFDPDKRKAAELRKRLHLGVCGSGEEVLKKADVVVLAFKPQELKPSAEMLRSHLRNQLVISILAGTPIAKLKSLLGSEVRFVRAMPNLGALVGASITALTGNPKGLKISEHIFSCCGKTLRLPERHFDLVTAVSGSGPAYFFLLMEMLVAFAKTKGLSDSQANLLVAQTASGAGEIARLSGDFPAALRKRVTSKGGTTQAALSVLLEGQFDTLFYRALQKAIDRAREINRS